MSGWSLVSVSAAVVAGLVLLWLAVRTMHVIPQASVAIVERNGRFARVLNSGFHLVIPFIHTIRNRIDMREQVVPLPPQPVITADNLVVNIDTVIYYQVLDPRAATYEVASYFQAIEYLTVTTLRTIVSSMSLEQLLTSREEVNAGLRGVLDESTGKWGIRIHRVELKAIEPPTSIQDSMEKTMRADRDKRAAVLMAEGVRQSEILRAEGEAKAAVLRAEGEIEIARLRRAAEAEDAGAGAARHPAPPAPEPVRHQPLHRDDPDRIGRYRLTARLGEGGMGTVYLGMSPGGRRVAVKVVRQELAQDRSFRLRFAREVDAVRRVGGFHTAPVVDAGPDDALPWLVTEYIPGPSLHEVLRTHGALPATGVRALALGLAEAMEGIHACGLIHRDLKPGNIVISGVGPRVIDFGIARAAEGTSLTTTDVVVGTRGFLAPEQLTGGPLTPAVDAYAFGMVLCHAYGAAPSAGGTVLDQALRTLPADLSAVVGDCLRHDPAARPTPAEILQRLDRSGEKALRDRLPEDWLPEPVRALVARHQAVTAPRA